MSLIYLNNLITELQTLRIKTVIIESQPPRVSLCHYDQPLRYDQRLRKMERAALTDLLTLGERQLELAIKRLNNINESIQECSQVAYYEFALATKDHPVNIEHITDVLLEYDIDIEGVNGFSHSGDRDQYSTYFVLPLLRLMSQRMTTIDSLIAKITHLNSAVSYDDFDSVFPPERTDNKHISYKWLLTIDQLKELHRTINGVLIADTSEANFIDAFTQKPIGSFSPVRWRDDSPSEVVYFIQELIIKDCIYESKKTMKHQKLIGCICKPNGQPFDAATLATSKNSLGWCPTQDKKQPIQNVINQVRSPSH